MSANGHDRGCCCDDCCPDYHPLECECGCEGYQALADAVRGRMARDAGAPCPAWQRAELEWIDNHGFGFVPDRDEAVEAARALRDAQDPPCGTCPACAAYLPEPPEVRERYALREAAKDAAA